MVLVINFYRISKTHTLTLVTFLTYQIETHHGVTQGKNSSADIFSFYVSDMHLELDVLQLGDSMGQLDLLRMTDDTTILADNFSSLTGKSKNSHGIF